MKHLFPALCLLAMSFDLIAQAKSPRLATVTPDTESQLLNTRRPART